MVIICHAEGSVHFPQEGAQHLNEGCGNPFRISTAEQTKPSGRTKCFNPKNLN